MTQIRIQEDIRPISDLKSGAAEIIEQATQSGRPVVLTKHGRGVAVLLSVAEYEHLTATAERLALLEALRAGERDIDEGRTISHADVRRKYLRDAT